MANPGISHDTAREVLAAYAACGKNQVQTAKCLGRARQTVAGQIRIAERMQAAGILEKQFTVENIPSFDMPIDDLRELRRKTWQTRHAAETARKLIQVKVHLDGHIGILHFGDPHIDDDGCNFPKLESDVELCQNTPGLLAGNVGDLHNNWICRLAALYGNQTTSAAQAWKLVEWFVKSLNWLYIVKGNHDCWSGAGDPLDFIKHAGIGALEAHGARLNLVFPNRKQVRVNARHDFAGHSMWNPNHGPVKAIKAGWRDHLLTCGHIHETGFGPPLKDPATGLISWPIRCAGYKVHDDYGNRLGLPDQNIAPSILTVIDPRYDDDDPRLITPFLSPEEGASYLTYLRKKAGAQDNGRRVRGR